MCEVGKRIRSRRIELNFSAEELADMVGLSPATIYRYENGDIKKVSTSKIKPFAVALKTSAAYLMGWVDDPSANLSLDNDEMGDILAPRTISADALKVARAYDMMSDYGKAIIDLVVAQEEKRHNESLGETKLLCSSGVAPQKMTVIEMEHPSVTQAKYNAKQELKELAQDQTGISQEET